MEKIERRVLFNMAESQILEMKLKFQTKDGFILASTLRNSRGPQSFLEHCLFLLSLSLLLIFMFLSLALLLMLILLFQLLFLLFVVVVVVVVFVVVSCCCCSHQRRQLQTPRDFHLKIYKCGEE